MEEQSLGDDANAPADDADAPAEDADAAADDEGDDGANPWSNEAGAG